MAAKKVRISNDAGTTWEELPGSQAGFDSNAESIEDTILGQSFSSSEIGLVDWSVSSDGIYKGYAGYLAEIKQVGTPVPFTDETMSLVTGLTYAIDDTTKELWNKDVPIVVSDNAVPVATVDIESIDYLYGRITFVGTYSVTGPITVTGESYPVSAIGCSNTYNLSMSADAIDETCFNIAQANDGRRVFRAGLRTVALELTGIFDATENAKAVLLSRQVVIIEIDPAGDGGSVARGYFKLVTTGQSGAVGALEEETLNFELTVPQDVEIPFNWKHTNTTLALSIQWVLDSWLSELNTSMVQYLPTGAVGASPLDGIEGAFVVTDVSLSGGLSNMNTFQVELQGTGAYTEV